jgi:UDP-N-acetylmuramoyl-tripeptide--D-alanyl-D-alanine ligase
MKELARKLIVHLLTLEAKLVVKKYRPNVVVVTGSVGKTSTKDAVYAALSSSHFVRKSEKSFNSELGVPLTILGLPNAWSNPLLWVKNLLEGLSLLYVKAPYPTWLVLEVGADKPGDITKSLSWLSPKVVVTTRFPDIPVHVEFYESPEEVVSEELAPVLWLTEGGVLAVSQDESRAKGMPVPAGVKKISYGFEAGAEVKGSRYHVSLKNKMPTGISFDVLHEKEKGHVTLPGVIGKTHALPVLGGIAAALGVGVSLAGALKSFEHHEPPPGRMRLIPGKLKTVIIDDSYNSSPVACAEALLTLAECPRTGRRIAVLADMLELGKYSVPEHKRIGEMIPSTTDVLVTVGIRSRDIAKTARELGMPPAQVTECDRAEDAAGVVASLMQEGDVILVKGSQSMRMERVVRSLMQEPGHATKLLVRHDADWLQKP